ncbi:aspartate aminotransferase family protein [Halalkalibacter nanhaiisediminis]|uniref:glutamate-1-semialdehyde 2,1-aminomutase n=1 Tax=Halalkalibacter nanhaiisediminis TaxID=688079 RepID=A0A562QLW1_9BACI|nr:aspartate aminotransferase family protein [Halalkalibacter nanhaiisediminis]TWI57180.1 glutamate-1-semialdehyde 2,1-aminomutase [Halalkalibacter nanhaiisediminis]
MAIERDKESLVTFLEKTNQSKRFLEKAEMIMPGGVTANIKYFAPYPIVLSKAQGAYVTDVDGNQYIDYLLSYGALMLGHGHSQIKEAVVRQLEEDGTNLFGTPHQLEVEMGETIQTLYPSMERLRYTNSGTEATLLALRIAAAYTGKRKIAKFEGHYHGGYDEVLVSVNPSLAKAGPEERPHAVLESKGMSQSHLETTIVLPFNDLESCEQILRDNHKDISAVIIEPLQAGFIPAKPIFIEGLRKLTEELDILLIFDEVKTGFRVSLGGAQELYHVEPDITTLGKVIGGGFPVGIVGGRKDIMMVSAPKGSADVFDHSQSKGSSASEVLFHSGTYNGHPTILAAGLATISVLKNEMNHVLNTTEELKSRLEWLFQKHHIPMKAIGVGSIFSVVLTEIEKIQNYRDLQLTNLRLRKEIDLHLLGEGIYMKPLNRYSLSTAHTELEVKSTVQAYEHILAKGLR